MDLALVAHLATLESSVPFLHFFDGFRTSHEVQKIDAIDQGAGSVGRCRARVIIRSRAPPRTPDIYQNREAANKYYNAVPEIVEEIGEEGLQPRAASTSCSSMWRS